MLIENQTYSFWRPAGPCPAGVTFSATAARLAGDGTCGSRGVPLPAGAAGGGARNPPPVAPLPAGAAVPGPRAHRRPKGRGSTRIGALHPPRGPAPGYQSSHLPGTGGRTGMGGPPASSAECRGHRGSRCWGGQAGADPTLAGAPGARRGHREGDGAAPARAGGLAVSGVLAYPAGPSPRGRGQTDGQLGFQLRAGDRGAGSFAIIQPRGRRQGES